MFATLPLEAFVCREVLENYFWPEEEYNQRRHVIITTSLVGSAMLGELAMLGLYDTIKLTVFTLAVSLMTCDLGVILELAGGFSATALAYIFRRSSPFSTTPSSSHYLHHPLLSQPPPVTFDSPTTLARTQDLVSPHGFAPRLVSPS